MESAFPETELHKLIRYGWDFVVEEKMRELDPIRAENRKMKRTLKQRRKRDRRRAQRGGQRSRRITH